MPPLLQLDSITKSFQAVRALKGVSFSLDAGEVHALLGENGAGKSTLIKVIAGAHSPDSGTMAIDGQVVSRLTPASARQLGIAAIYQQPALFPDLSAAENIALGLEAPQSFRRVRWAERRSRARELLQRVGAQIDPDTEIRRLSMPQQQLIEIARSLGAGARILIMDEPTASLTRKEVELLFAVIRDLRRDGVGVIYISHRLEEIFAVGDRVTVLRDGESVGTNEVGQINEAGLIRMMVGREVSAIYPVAENAPGEPVLSLSEVNCAAGGICNISFEVRAGEVFGLAGVVGAGRTELARVLFGITPADSGSIALHGQPICIHSPRDAIALGIGYVPEDRRRHGVILAMSVAANITMGIHPVLFPGGWLRFRAEHGVAEKYIRELAIKTYSPDSPAGTLSGGNQQKVALARWLAAGPKVLILDEPTQGVDVGAKSEIHKWIRRLAAQGLAVIMISSDLPEVLGMSTRIGVMRGGTLAAILDGHTATAQSVMAAALGQETMAA
ncbi:MAG TPA: sugar ABC transporter ATP-binding protein [Candidatus Saccharimonadales bacterium]|nr:sugar ABC transporter ATP-binding protein [Candidatus Saccharimonadales bacterium]